MLFGSVPTPPRKPRSSTRIQSARQRTTAASTAHLTTRGTPVRKSGPDQRQGQDGKEVGGPTVGRIERPERRYPRREQMGLRSLGHLLDHGRERPGLTARAYALPEAAPRPRLKDGHPREEKAKNPYDHPAQSRSGPGRKGKCDQHPRHAVEQDGSGGSEEPGKTGGENPSRRLRRTPTPPVPSRRWPDPPAAISRPWPPRSATRRYQSGSTPRPPGRRWGGSSRWWPCHCRGAAPSPARRLRPGRSPEGPCPGASRLVLAGCRRISREARKRP